MSMHQGPQLPIRKRVRGHILKSECDESLLPFVVIGGGIAGVSCAQELSRLHSGKIVIISASDVLKEAVGVMEISKYLHDFEIYEKTSSSFVFDNPGVEVLVGEVLRVDYDHRSVILRGGRVINYRKLCVCSGASPQLIVGSNANVVGIRDTESVELLLNRLKVYQNAIIVGNGGIALELIHELRACNVEWIIKDGYIGSAFFDAMASKFIMPSLYDRLSAVPIQEDNNRPPKTEEKEKERAIENATERKNSYAVGPDWNKSVGFSSILGSNKHQGALKVHYSQEVSALYNKESNRWDFLSSPEQDTLDVLPDTFLSHAVIVKTTNGTIVTGDFLISATGSRPNTDFLSLAFNKTSDGSLIVDDYMRTNIQYVYSAGDCCEYQPKLELNSISNISESMWFQMRLWSQAKSQGSYAARCMLFDEEAEGNFIFSIFAHVTRFFGHKVVLLGRYNGQGLSDDLVRVVKEFTVADGKLCAMSDQIEDAKLDKASIEIWNRWVPEKEYIKLVLFEGKIIGAMLIGNTELGETFENLILNQIDISRLGIGILDPDLDIEEYFD